MFSPEADDDMAILLTFTGTGIATPIRITNTPKERLTALTTNDEVVYGITSRGNDYIYIPFQLTLPDEQVSSAPRCQLSAQDVTRYLTPVLRSITSPPSVLIELVMTASPGNVEISFSGFQMGAVNYSANVVTAELMVQSLAAEPFPAHTFTPSYFPGLF